ncbi:MAG: tyrosine-type recombinase/integrase [Gloeobacteraceae cyanobacterium ES-bin-316]|nr:tyrosine-type recombinase/integrase [Ferruginibacter sp.]
MNKNEISAKQLNEDAQKWIEKLRQALLIQDKGKGTVKNYSAEMILLFKYHNNKTVAAITQADIEQYIVYIKTVHQVGRAKCRSVASACAYFYKQVIKMPYILPSALYPQKQFILPNIMSQHQVTELFAAPLTLKEYCVIGLLYGSGLRISEVASLRIQDIDSPAKRIKVVQGKGAKDRFTLLASNLLEKLRQYYVAAKRPKEILFTSTQTGKAFHPRSMQLVVTGAMKKAGFAEKGYTSHTLRHSFATHMLDNGSNIHVIKTLLGHSKIETTMVYLHLQQHTQFGIVSPLDKLLGGTNGTAA